MRLFQSGKSVARSLTGWGRARMPALLHALEKATALGSAAVLGRINPMADRAPVSIRQIRRPIFDWLGAGKNARAPACAGKGNDARGARPSPAASTRRPIVHLLVSRKSGARTFTGWVRPRMDALLHALEKAMAPGSEIRGRWNSDFGCGSVCWLANGIARCLPRRSQVEYWRRHLRFGG